MKICKSEQSSYPDSVLVNRIHSDPNNSQTYDNYKETSHAETYRTLNSSYKIRNIQNKHRLTAVSEKKKKRKKGVISDILDQ